MQPKRLVWLAAILAAAVSPSAAYYHFVHYLNSSSPYSVVFEKYDITALPDQTVTFFVSDNGPTSYSANDSFPSLLGQIRNATQVWNSVASSNLRVGFGGLQSPGTQQNVPTGEVVFEELPPGVLAFAGHSVAVNGIATASDGTQFVPILGSLVHLNINLMQQAGAANGEGYAGPSYSESFFTTLVHEMGHAIGLQHTFTSSTMSTAVSRATNRAKPLDADDIASVSLLYPRGGFPAGYGSISGQVTMNGQGVHMASVVALLPNGSAVSNLTNPDGSYRIDGLPPGSYWVYVHPLPPTALPNILLPVDASGNPVAASAPFVSTFYPGTWDPSQFTSIAVAQGASVGGIDFAVQPRSDVPVYDVTSYWYGTAYNQPAYLNANSAVQTVVAQGAGLASPDNSTPVQSAVALGAPGGFLADYGSQVYQDVDVMLLAMYFDYQSTPAPGPEHLLFQLADDIFVLPQGIQIVQSGPPVITGVTPNGDGSVTVAGTGLTTDSRVFFDSLPGRVTVPYASSQTDTSIQAGSLSVMPPPGANSQTATVTVYNPDGQNSTFEQAQTFTYAYAPADPPAAAIAVYNRQQAVPTLPQGISAMVNITSSNMQFVEGLTTLGFGSGDVAVRRLWVLNPTHAVANVTVSPNAIVQRTAASVISGFEVYEQTPGFQVAPANASLPVIGLPVPNAFYPVQNSLYPGAIASVYGLNLQANGGVPTINVAGQSAQLLYYSPSQINFVIPVGIPAGPAVMTLQNGLLQAYPVVLQIDAPPPVIVSALSLAGTFLGAAENAAPGDTITLTISGVDASVISNPARIGVAEGGVSIPAFQIQQAQDGSSNLLLQFVLTASVVGQQVPVTVSLDGDLSTPYYIDVVATQVAGGQ